jgi:hypothetical protein
MPVRNIGEGSDHVERRYPLPGPYGQSLTTRQVESLHFFFNPDSLRTRRARTGERFAFRAIPPRPKGPGLARKI